MSENNVCTVVVEQDLCVGCGVCAGICPHHNLVMKESQKGGYVPSSLGHCVSSCSECLEVCPFYNDDVDEDVLGENLYSSIQGIQHRNETGYFLDTYVGHVTDPAHRWKSASGGLATWFLTQLLVKDIVDHIICVTPNSNPQRLFDFEILSHSDEIIRSAKSAYYPVELSGGIRTVLERPGRYALIGLPCFVKAVCLASLRNVKLRDRIKVCAGLVCGGLRTKAFAESLIRRMGLDPKKIDTLSFREKVPGYPASNYAIVASDGENSGSLEQRGFPGFVWMSGMFKLKSCNFCDDVFAELSDITFMDAWLPEYTDDSAGTSLVITRSVLADQIIREGVENGECILDGISVEQVIESQNSLVKIKRDMLSHRLWVEAQAGRAIPQKRVAAKKPRLLDRLHILNAESIRERSFTALSKQRQSEEPGLAVFMEEMQRDLRIRKWLYRLKRENIKSGLRRRIERVKNAIRSFFG